MAYEKKAGESKLFRNKNKVKDSDADYQGYYLHEDGVTEEGINAWINTSANGDKYMKLSFWNKAETAAKGVRQARQAMQPKELDDDLPF